MQNNQVMVLFTPLLLTFTSISFMVGVIFIFMVIFLHEVSKYGIHTWTESSDIRTTVGFVCVCLVENQNKTDLR